MSTADPHSASASPVPGRSLATKINHLFETIRRPDGRRYSNDEVAEAINGRGTTTISGTYLWYLRRGERDNPSKKHLEVLARFFDVSPAYFFDDDPPPRPAGQQPPGPVDAHVRRVACRLDGLSARSLCTVAALIDRVRELEGLPPGDPDGVA